MITPTVLLLTGVGFFSLLLFGEPLAPLLGSLGITPLLAAVYVGALQNIFSKSAKYSLFDPCKEMAYIPLDEDMKVRIPGASSILYLCLHSRTKFSNKNLLTDIYCYHLVLAQALIFLSCIFQFLVLPNLVK